MDAEKTQLLLRLPADLKAALQREATLQGRKVTQEVVIRLTESLKAVRPGGVPANYSTGHKATAAVTGESDHTAQSDTERALLKIIKKMPPEQQQALLTLFK
ncbi:hypothetical protein [Rhodoferax sp.]|uniref:hypothetical protein n=1 Tax=Rhodoferax sp. TaxID=50421 RepID=UPI002773D77B|nr:hypothetical protein [Rhodoferax sp.]